MAADLRVLSFASKLAPCTVAMEACCGAHYLHRFWPNEGTMSPEYVRPCVKAQKNDDRDAEAIRISRRTSDDAVVEFKSEAQLDV
ncbi:MAG: transposase [Mesorhizobium sp.]|nr:MAG: transposase [Mesorhizobium sp.]